MTWGKQILVFFAFVGAAGYIFSVGIHILEGNVGGPTAVKALLAGAFLVYAVKQIKKGRKSSTPE